MEAQTPSSYDQRFKDLMQAGRAALTAGKPQLAHDLWREAAAIDPYNEQVWLALLEVLDTDRDRLVCLKNIVSINPLNVQARRQFNRLNAQIQRAARGRTARRSRQAGSKRQRRGLLRQALLVGIAIGLSGVFFGVVMSIFLYAR